MLQASIYFTAQNVNGKRHVKKPEMDAFPGMLSHSSNDETECIAVDFNTTGVGRERLAYRTIHSQF